MVAHEKIRSLQATCKHVWCFNRQENAHHERDWHVTYKCGECDLERRETKPPVCASCDVPLYRAGADDTDAEQERRKEKYQGRDNPPIAFRCPRCHHLHILWLLGD